MKWLSMIGIIAFVTATTGCAAQRSEVPRECAYTRQSMMALSFGEFDGTQGAGWRVVGDRAGCERVGADLIAAYRREHRQLSAENRISLNWHEGQLRAAAGDYGAAAALMDAARPQGDVERNLYIDATLAFLRNDAARLREVRARYVQIPEPEGFREGAERFRQRTGHSLLWPINLSVIDGLANCIGRPYREAYSPTCQSLAPRATN